MKDVRIDELITCVYADEVCSFDADEKKAEGTWTDEKRKRIEETIVSVILSETDKKNVVQGKSFGKKKKRKWLVLLLAATLVIAFGLTTAAAVQHDWDVALANFMGISGADTVQLEDGNVSIGVSDWCKGTDYGAEVEKLLSSKDESISDWGMDNLDISAGEKRPVRLTAVSSVGDKNAVYIRFDTDYEVPESFDPDQDYVLPENLSWYITRQKRGKGTVIGNGGMYTCLVEDGKLVLMLEVSGSPGINRANMRVCMENLVLYHGDKETLLYDGDWELEWKYSYRTRIRKKYCFTNVNSDSEISNGNDSALVFLTKVEVTPLGIQLEGVKNPMNRKGTDLFRELQVEKITFLNGDTLELDGTSSGGSRNNTWLHSYTGLDVLGEVLDVDSIYSITVGGKEIIL